MTARRRSRIVAAVVDWVAPVLAAAWLAMLVIGAVTPDSSVSYPVAIVLTAVMGCLVEAARWGVRHLRARIRARQVADRPDRWREREARR